MLLGHSPLAVASRAGAATAAAYGETGTLGQTEGTSQYQPGSNQKTVIPITVPSGGVWAKRIVVAMDTCFTGSQRAIIYTDSAGVPSALTKQGVDTATSAAISNTDLDLWLNADHSAVFLVAGNYWIGSHGQVASYYKRADAGSPSRYANDTFSDGSSNPFGASSTFSTYIRATLPYSVTGP